MSGWKQIWIAIVMTSASMTNSEVSAQDIETLIMPGDVISGHVELETECTSCHKRFDKEAQKMLCMDCHEDVAKDVEDLTGFHGLFADARNSQCFACHTEHKGRDANVVILDEVTFNHEFTDFELIGSHVEVECEGCHVVDAKRREALGLCNDCHSEDDVHKESLGTDCAACHKSTEWDDAIFDHDTTDYALFGKHAETACLDCHEDETYLDAPTTCYGCHAEDDAHDGRSGQKCENCHNPSDWNDSSFDHARDTEFPLDGKHAQLTCVDCHSGDVFKDQMDTACVSCHLEDDEHDGHNGDSCDSCHSNDDWAEPVFDHDRDTDYKLLGGHREVACVDCHVEPIFEVALKTTCDTCHLDSEPHEGSLGTQCESCHTEVNWQDPVFFDHDLTRFPLLGKHDENECEDCHTTQAFSDIESDCVSCHVEEDPHRGKFHDRCTVCHNPVAWDIWIFDHDVQTEFPLDGAHVDVACEDCHRSPLERIRAVDGSCRNCHRADDVHDGEFGFDCGRCHAADSFREVRLLQ